MKGSPQKGFFYAILLGDYYTATKICLGNALELTASEHQVKLSMTSSSITLEKEPRMIVYFSAKEKLSLGVGSKPVKVLSERERVSHIHMLNL